MTLAASTWYHVLVEFNSATDQASIAVNNGAVFSTTVEGGPYSGNGAFQVGSLAGAGGPRLYGGIDALHFFNRLLSDSEKAHLAIPVEYPF